MWQRVKPYVQELTQSKEVITLSFDDSIEEKPYTDKSELNCWHYDHSFGKSVKGINFLTALVQIADMRLACSVEFVKKDTWVTDEKTGKQKCKASITKNELFRKMLRECHKKMHFDYVLTDSWYSIKHTVPCKCFCDIEE